MTYKEKIAKRIKELKEMASRQTGRLFDETDSGAV